MKLKNIRKACARLSSVYICDTQYGQWIGDGRAFFPTEGVPAISIEIAPAIMDINPGKEEQWTISKIPSHCLPHYKFVDDVSNAGSYREISGATITWKGRTLSLLVSADHDEIAFIDAFYVDLIRRDSEEKTSIYLCNDLSGMFFLARRGTIPCAIISYPKIQGIAQLDNLLVLSSAELNLHAEEIDNDR